MWHFIMTMTDDKMTLRDIGNKHRVHWVLNLYNIILIIVITFIGLSCLSLMSFCHLSLSFSSLFYLLFFGWY